MIIKEPFSSTDVTKVASNILGPIFIRYTDPNKIYLSAVASEWNIVRHIYYVLHTLSEFSLYTSFKLFADLIIEDVRLSLLVTHLMSMAIF